MSSLIENQNRIPALEAEIVELKAEIVLLKVELKAEGKSASEILVLLSEMIRRLAGLEAEKRIYLEQQTSAAPVTLVGIEEIVDRVVDRARRERLEQQSSAAPAMSSTAPVTLVGIEEIVDRVVDRAVEPLRRGVAVALYTALDPWDHIVSVDTTVATTQGLPLIDTISAYYGISKSKYCMFFGPVTHCDILCAHLWPSHTVGEGLQVLGLSKVDVNQPRNFLRLHKGLEKAFDRKRIIFEHHPMVGGNFKLKLCVLDPSFEQEVIAFNNQLAITGAAIKDTLSHYTFCDARKPFGRVLAVHSQKSMTSAKQRGWISDVGSSVAFRDRSIALARLALEPPNYAVLFPDV